MVENKNPGCPKCGKPGCKNGKTNAGFQRYRCYACSLSYTPDGMGVGRQCVGDKPMSSSERGKAFRARKAAEKLSE